jgi:hypothetical protein
LKTFYKEPFFKKHFGKKVFGGVGSIHFGPRSGLVFGDFLSTILQVRRRISGHD